MMQQSELNHQSLTKYMAIYSTIPAILMAEGQFVQAVGQIRANLLRYAQWKELLQSYADKCLWVSMVKMMNAIDT